MTPVRKALRDLVEMAGWLRGPRGDPAVYVRSSVALALAVVIAAAAGLTGQAALRGLVVSAEGRRRATASARAMESLAGAVCEAEGGQRGYLLTADPDYLDPYHDARGRVEGLLEAAAAGPWPPAAVAALRRDVTAKMAELEQTVRLARAGRRAEALAVVKTGHGARLGEGIRTRARGLVDDADAVANARTRALVRSGRFALLALPLAAALCPLLLATAAAVAYRARRDAERAAHDAELVRARARDDSRFMNHLSHNIRGPLNSVVLEAEIARGAALRPPVDVERVRECLAGIVAATQEVSVLLDRLLDRVRSWPDLDEELGPVTAQSAGDGPQRPRRPGAAD